MKILIYLFAMLIGIFLGSILVPSGQVDQQSNRTLVLNDAQRRSTRQVSQSNRIGQLLASESDAVKRDITFKQAFAKLDTRQRSPLRLRSFMDYRVHLLPKETLLKALAAGEIRGNAELAEAARRLTNEDPHKAFDVYMKRSFGPRTMENVYAYVHAMLWTWVQNEPQSLLKRIQEMPRGGSQQDTSLTFSDYWARHDPAEAVKHFDQLVALRNMYDHSQGEMTTAQYAETITRSWLKKNPEEVMNYVRNLTGEDEKKHFKKALDKLVFKKKKP